MKIGKWRCCVFVVSILLTMLPVVAEKGGKGKGGGGGGSGGGETCTPSEGNFPIGQVLDASIACDGCRLSGLAASLDSAGDVLLAVTGSSSASTYDSIRYLVIFRYDGIGHPVNTIDVDSAGLKANTIRLVDLDGDGYATDLLLGSEPTNEAAVIRNVDGNSPTPEKLWVPADAEFFGTAVAFDGEHIYIGARVTDGNAGAVYIYNADSTYKEKLPPPEGGDGTFGRSLAVAPNGDLYVGAPWANDGKTREAGAVIHYRAAAGREVWEDPAPNRLTRGIRGEELGRDVAVANDDALVALPWQAESGAMFWESSEPAEDLLFAESRNGILWGLTTGDMNGTGGDEIAFLHQDLGIAYLYVDGQPGDGSLSNPKVLEDPTTCQGLTGRGAAIVNGMLFLTDRDQDLNGDGTEDGQIYVYALP